MIFTQLVISGDKGIPLKLSPGDNLCIYELPSSLGKGEVFLPVSVTKPTWVDAVYVCRLLDTENRCISNPLFFAHEINTSMPSEILSIEETSKILSAEEINKIRQSILLYDSYGAVEFDPN